MIKISVQNIPCMFSWIFLFRLMLTNFPCFVDFGYIFVKTVNKINIPPPPKPLLYRLSKNNVTTIWLIVRYFCPVDSKKFSVEDKDNSTEMWSIFRYWRCSKCLPLEPRYPRQCQHSQCSIISLRCSGCDDILHCVHLVFILHFVCVFVSILYHWFTYDH
jgi:hypothetical protein